MTIISTTGAPTTRARSRHTDTGRDAAVARTEYVEAQLRMLRRDRRCERNAYIEAWGSALALTLINLTVTLLVMLTTRGGMGPVSGLAFMLMLLNLCLGFATFTAWVCVILRTAALLVWEGQSSWQERQLIRQKREVIEEAEVRGALSCPVNASAQGALEIVDRRGGLELWEHSPR